MAARGPFGKTTKDTTRISCLQSFALYLKLLCRMVSFLGGLPFGLANSLSSTLDYNGLLRTLAGYTRLSVKNLLRGKI